MLINGSSAGLFAAVSVGSLRLTIGRGGGLSLLELFGE